MSSLQQALNNATNKFGLKKIGARTNSGEEKGSGEFESCFAQGLDISELISGSSGGNQQTSAAEELLKIKQTERRQRQIQEEEEQKMQTALQKKLDSLKQHHNKTNQPKRSSFEIGDALVRMHGSDELAASVLSQKATHRKGHGASNRRRNSRPSHKSNKSLVAKKSRRSKF